ncbi:TetR/AcrR family transcriptional regulator [Streptomyces sp. NPDC058579]|uniref:TetR/AcrR family transcriptional regulator n=1 Tax=Streptomyces sp. NPDC058579 TaxID=3346548 RepID=UPI00364AD7F8
MADGKGAGARGEGVPSGGDPSEGVPGRGAPSDRAPGDGGGSFLPASIEAAWGLRERPSKGPKPGLTLDRIVGTAVTVASTEGLDALSMGRIAKELGVSTMSLYRYVGAKSELYVLMQDVATGPPPASLPAGTGWREGVEHWARELREIYHQNLWMLRMPLTGPPATPNSVAWWERAMVALDGTGLDEGTKVSVVMLVSGFVRNEALMMADIGAVIGASGERPEEALARYGHTLRRLADPERYPAVARMLDSGVMGQADEPDYEFRFGLARILDGVALLVDGKEAGASG